MNPIVVQRFGPWIGRIVKEKPGLLATLVAKMRTAGAIVGDKVGDVVTYFKASPVKGALTLTTLASLGIAAADLFDGIDDEDGQSFAEGLSKTEAAARKKAAELITKAGSSSEALLEGDVENEAETYVLQDVLSWAVRHYGSINAALRAHRMQQAFFELPSNKAAFGFQTLRLN